MQMWEEVGTTDKKLKKILCNCCGDEILSDKTGRFFSYFHGETRWQYGSKFDNEEHSFDLCENCYEKWMNGFSIPVERKNQI